MDAFYASVAQHDDPGLKGKPVIVAWRGQRSVVCAASYEARRFGIHSAMPASRAERLCPTAIFVPPDFSRYRAVSRAVHAILARHSTLIEPLSLDEAYLDVTDNLLHLPSATAVASAIRTSIRQELGLTASAGIAANKFLAKIASDWNKPDGQFVIKPHQVERFLTPLPVRKIPGVGKVMEGRLARHGILTVGQLRERPLGELQAAFGQVGAQLYQRARGIDPREIVTERPVQSVSAEDTLAEDQTLDALAPLILRLSDKVWQAQARTSRQARTVVLKLKTADFRLLTRSHTPSMAPRSLTELQHIALLLRQRVNLDPATRYRLVGVGLANFDDTPDATAQSDLF